eukprot:7222478-Prymnesium_polylepis.1
MKPLEKTPKVSRGVASGSAASTHHQVCLQIYTAPGRHALRLFDLSWAHGSCELVGGGSCLC